MTWFAKAPANIALIKYMGKSNTTQNLPSNASLSYTLENLQSFVELEVYPGESDLWEPLEMPGATPFELSEKAQLRFLNHLQRLKDFFKYQGHFIVRSCNNFPQGTGLASSASSFAALTKAACLALAELTQMPIPDTKTQAALSRQGSGSSCRSFYSPWALWQGEDVSPIALPYTQFIHQVILISHAEKQVSSSEAHLRVPTSPLYNTREQQAEHHLKTLIDALQNQDWPRAYEICWQEFQAMHQLFATAQPPFSYMTEKSEEVLKQLQDFWRHHQDGPIVTMDAGPNIHLLWRQDQAHLAQVFQQTTLVGQFDVL